MALMIAAMLGANSAHAQDATWKQTPTSGDFNTGSNWSSNAVPIGMAYFGTSNTTSLTFSADTLIDGWTFNAGADDYNFTIGGGHTLEFDTAGILVNGGSATITNNAHLYFRASSSAGSATITNNAELLFFNHSTAGSATITNSDTLGFLNQSSAGNATVTNNFKISFVSSSSAGSSTITNNGVINFYDSSSADNATITNAYILYFRASSTAGNATITTENLTAALFYENSTGGQAEFITNAGGWTDFSGSSGPLGDNKLTAGSLAGAGSYYLGANQLTVGGNDLSTVVSGVISDCGATGTECTSSGATGGSLVKVGTGTLTLTGANTYTGATTVDGGTLVVNGSITSDVTVNAGGTLGGSGTVGDVAIMSGGIIAPGNSPGTLHVSNVSFDPGSIYRAQVEAGGAHDLISASGSATINGGTVQVLAYSGNYKPQTKYTILTASGGRTGTFSNVTSNLVFLDPSLSYDANNVYLLLTRNSTLFRSLARTPNQKAVAGALDHFPTNNALFLNVLNQTASGARQALLSGW